MFAAVFAVTLAALAPLADPPQPSDARIALVAYGGGGDSGSATGYGSYVGSWRVPNQKGHTLVIYANGSATYYRPLSPGKCGLAADQICKYKGNLYLSETPDGDVTALFAGVVYFNVRPNGDWMVNSPAAAPGVPSHNGTVVLTIWRNGSLNMSGLNSVNVTFVRA